MYLHMHQVEPNPPSTLLWQGEEVPYIKTKEEKILTPVWSNLKPYNPSRISLKILVIHDSKAQVVINEIFLLFAL